MKSDKPPRGIIIKGHKILVDAEDYEFLIRIKWNVYRSKKVFYARASAKFSGKAQTYSMHRLICGFPSSMIDHKNRNGLDNRKENLRFCTAKENSYNRVRFNKHNLRGVLKAKNSPTYTCQIQKGKIRVKQYGFITAEDAARAYDKLSLELHGEFGIRNFPEDLK